MNEDDLLRRTKQFALRVMKLVAALPNTPVGRAIGGQFVRAGTSVGANYRAACRGRSRAEFAAKVGTVEEEADESAFWMEMIMEGGLLADRLVVSLHREAQELTAIMASSRKTTLRNAPPPPSRRSRSTTPPGSDGSSSIANRKSQIANPRGGDSRLQ